MKQLKWVFAHEPALLAGVVAALAVFFSVRYGTHTDAAMQGTLGGLVLTVFGTLRNFVTSPATKALLDTAPGQIAPIADDVTYLKQFVGEAITHPGGLYGLLATHAEQVRQAFDDLESRVVGLVHSDPVGPAATVSADPPKTEAAPVTITEPVQTATEPVVTTPAPDPSSDAVAELSKLVP